MPTLPVRYTSSVELVEADEQKTIEELTETLIRISDTTFADSGHAWRSVHAKSHGIIDAELTILDALPPELEQGLFSRQGSFPVVMRYSTIPGDVLDDSVTVPRGVAIKVMEVPGDRLAGSKADKTQDFVMVDGPAFAAPTAKKFLANLKMLAKTPTSRCLPRRRIGRSNSRKSYLRLYGVWRPSWRLLVAKARCSRLSVVMRMTIFLARNSTRRRRSGLVITSPRWPLCRLL